MAVKVSQNDDLSGGGNEISSAIHRKGENRGSINIKEGKQRGAV